METDFVMLPLANYPKVGHLADRRRSAARSTVTSPTTTALDNFDQWEDVDGDGQIVIGAEQWPGCLNPVTECANSSWSVWTATFPYLPAIWDTTNDQTFVHQRPGDRGADGRDRRLTLGHRANDVT